MDFSGVMDFDMSVMSLVNGSGSVFMDRLVVFLTNGLTWIPLYLSLIYLIVRNNDGIRQAVLLILCAAAMVGLNDLCVDQLVKPLVMRFRPSHEPQVMGLIHITDNIRGGMYGFFSAHASNTMSLALFFALVVRSKLLSVLLIGWSLVNCYTRMYLGLHYPSDILYGIGSGILFSVAFYFLYIYLYKKISHRTSFISTQYTSSGYAFCDINIVALTLACIFTVGTIWAIMW